MSFELEPFTKGNACLQRIDIWLDFLYCLYCIMAVQVCLVMHMDKLRCSSVHAHAVNDNTIMWKMKSSGEAVSFS